MKKLSTLLLSFILCVNLWAQVDTQFWFVDPEVTKGHADAPVYIRITAVEDATVTVSMPAEGIILVDNKLIQAGEQYSIMLPNDSDSEPIVENKPAATVNQKGILIEATAEVSAYYEVADSKGFNPEKFVLKGVAALGTEFMIPSQTKYRNRVWDWQYNAMTPRPTEKFDIVATEDNTVVTITITEDDKNGHLAGVPFTITLDRGETYMVELDVEISRVDFIKNTDTDLLGISLAGSEIASDKPIAVTISDDSINKQGEGAYDLIGDQLVPIDVIGTEYIAVNTQLRPEDVSEVYVLMTEDNTTVTIDGVAASGGPFNRGDQIVVTIENGASYIKADKAIYAYQVVGLTVVASGGKYHNEFGSAVLIPISGCSGSKEVSFQRLYGDTRYYIQLSTQGKHRDAFTLTQIRGGGIDQTALLNSLISWEIVPGTGTEDEAWYVANVNLSSIDIVTTHPYIIKNTKGLFHLGILEENGSSMSFGVFSSFSNLTLEGEAMQCEGEIVELKAVGNSLIESYQWRFGDPTDPTNDVTSVIGTSTTYEASKTGTYYLDGIAYGGCRLTREMEVQFIAPEVNLGGSVIKCPGEEVKLETQAGYLSYVWTGAVMDSDNPNVAFATATPGQMFEVSLTVVGNELGCTSIDVVTIESYDEVRVDLSVDSNEKLKAGDEISNLVHDPSYSYEWLLDGKAISDQRNDNSSIVVNQSGEYEVVVKSPYGCKVRKRVSVILLDTPVSIENKLNNGFGVYPNPSQGELSIVVGESASIALYNSLGQLVLKEEVQKGKFLNVSGIEKGFYLLKVNTESGEFVEKLIVE